VARIVFVAPFPRTEISGGIKTTYRHAELLTQHGFDAGVYQPQGRPLWFARSARIFATLEAGPADILVFPETLNGTVLERAKARVASRKILFCQNQYYLAMSPIPLTDLPAVGFCAFVCSSVAAQTFFRTVFQRPDVPIISYHVDPALFCARDKRRQIALVPRKMPNEAGLVRAILQAKYPGLHDLPWVAIDNCSEAETARIMGESAIFLALNYFESFGLTPIEAMSAGCIAAGFAGGGGREYANEANGIWVTPDRVEERADALALLVEDLARGDPRCEKQALRRPRAIPSSRQARPWSRSTDHWRGAEA
jgi:Glycosyl transferases group 1